jgi:GH35 family endo-1,4-beta-xylanase
MRNSMLIKGRLGDYQCRWTVAEYSKAVVRLYVQKEVKIFGFKFKYHKRVWESPGTGIQYNEGQASRFPVNEMTAWFRDVVREYERHKESWDTYNRATK